MLTVGKMSSFASVRPSFAGHPCPCVSGKSRSYSPMNPIRASLMACELIVHTSDSWLLVLNKLTGVQLMGQTGLSASEFELFHSADPVRRLFFVTSASKRPKYLTTGELDGKRKE